MSYTKGEWRVTQGSSIYVEAENQCICEVDFCDGTVSEKEHLANAQRIVTCVNSHNDLLKACRELLEFAEWTEKNTQARLGMGIKEKAQQVIDKVESTK